MAKLTDGSGEKLTDESVLLVPSKLTQSAYSTLLEAGCVPKRFHIEGRYGSRIHSYDKKRVAIPLLPSASTTFQSLAESHNKRHDGLRELLQTNGVTVIVKPVHVPTSIPRDESVDATVHPERASGTVRGLVKAAMKIPVNRRKTGEKNPPFTFAELFAGIGGFGVGLEALGGQCVFASEIDKQCRSVYLANMNMDPNLFHGDICAVPDDDIPSHDILVGGFPCQPFSSLGDQTGFADKKNRGGLYLQIIRVLRLRRPKAFLLENVPGLLETDGGSAIRTIKSDLESVGYTVSTEVCNARCLTAQSRKRLFLVGLANKIDSQGSNLSCTPFEFPYIPDLGVRAADIIEYQAKNSIQSVEETDNQMSIEKVLHLTDDQMNQLLHHAKRWKPAHLAWHDVVCNTLDSHYGVSVGKGNSQLVPCRSPLHPRRLSPRECARLMGFPNSFELPEMDPARSDEQGKRTFLKENYRMLGNAVCPPLIAVLAGAVLERCEDISTYDDWQGRGRRMAIHLALESVLPSRKEQLLIRLKLANEEISS